MNYTKEKEGNFLQIRLTDHLGSTTAGELVKDVLASIEADASILKIIIDVEEKYLFEAQAMRLLSQMAADLRRRDRSVYVLRPSRSFKSFINDMGLTSLLRPIATLEETLPTSVAKPKPIDVNFVNPFIEGTVETLKVQCSLECRPKSPFKKDKKGEFAKIDIAGVIGITSKGFNGSIAICFPKESFLGAMSNMLGEECKEITKDLEDGAGELLNIIFGYAKRVLNERGHSFEKAIPTIVSGSGIALRHMSAVTIVLPFETSVGDFYIEIGTESQD